MTWVKICGTTNLEDALLAVDAGADAIGFVFAPSKRRVTADTVAPIVAKMPSKVEKIGVFLNETAAAISKTAQDAGLTGVQLHGDETVQVAEQLASIASVTIVKGIHSGPAFDRNLQAWSRQRCVSALLLDSGNAQQGGGTGKTFDWKSAAEAVKGLNGTTRIIVAGGLHPENVEVAISIFHPWGVDVVSGVETEPGKKDSKKVCAFVAAVRGAH